MVSHAMFIAVRPPTQNAIKTIADVKTRAPPVNLYLLSVDTRTAEE